MEFDREVLVVAVVVFGIASALIVLPYKQYVLLAILLAYLLFPLKHRLERWIGSGPSAAVLVLVTFLIVLIPIAILLAATVEQATSLANAIASGDVNLGRFGALVTQQLGFSVDLDRFFGRTSVNADAVFGLLDSQSPSSVLGELVNVLGGISNVLGRISGTFVGLTVFLFLFYYLLKDGTSLLAWIESVSPLEESTWDRLHARIQELLWAVIVGNIAVGVVQGILVGIGFAGLKIPNAAFWTVVTTVLSLLPVIGASVVWLPTAGYLLVVGRPVTAAVLFVYGALVVSLSDNYLRPMIGGREAHLNPAVFVLGIFGGLAVFGFMGLFFGPVVLGVFETTVELFAERSSRPGSLD